MEFDSDILEQFFIEVIEDYRKKIQEQEEARRISRRQKELVDEVDKKMKAPCPNLYRLVTDYVSSIYDLNIIYQEQLYRQGVKAMKKRGRYGAFWSTETGHFISAVKNIKTGIYSQAASSAAYAAVLSAGRKYT